MKNRLKGTFGLFGIAAVLISGTTLAAGWSNVVTIDHIEVAAVGTEVGTYLSLPSSPSNKPTCGTASAVKLKGNAEQVRAMTSTATAAFLAGRQVKVYFTGNCTETPYADVTSINVL